MVAPLEPGDPPQVGRYRLLGRLGGGGMGEVFLARSPGGRLVAVKVIRPGLADDLDFRRRFAQEVETARAVAGIFTVPVVDADAGGRQPWLATAYVDGPSLAEAVATRGPLPADEVLALAAGLAEGLEAIHAAGVVHRDLKPSNVLLAADGPRIIDFGIARALDGTGYTRAGWVAGSPGFMSPEQATGEPTGPPSDIFSLGSVLAFAATGRGPFGYGMSDAVLYRVVHAQPDTRALPPRPRALVEHCLAKDPRHRPTAAQVVAALGEGDWFPWEHRARPDRRGRGLAWALTAGGAVLAAGIAVAAVLLLARSSAPTAPSPAAAPGSHPGSAPAGGSRLAGPSSPVTSLPASTSPASTQPASTRPAGSPSVTSPAGASWATYRDPGGWSIGVPPGWRLATAGDASQVDFAGPSAGLTALVAWTTSPRPDAYADWQDQAAARAASDPTYHQVAITRVSYRGWNAADWEFTSSAQGPLEHVLDRAFIVAPGQLAFAIEIRGPAAGFAAVRDAIWSGLLRTFRPPPGAG